jgi:CheY-like chemotaxis protein
MIRLRVMHVEDEPDIREVVEVSLGLDPEIESRSCGSGEEALDLVLDWPPDIILLDVMMPGMDGPATLARLRDDPRTANIPVIFMTARAQTRELDTFRALGAIGVIPKPFDPMTLAASVRSYTQPPLDELEGLRIEFLRRVSSDAATMTWQRRAIESATASPDVLANIQDIAHRLAGAAGIYGFPAIGDAAAMLEEAAVAALKSPGSNDGVTYALDCVLARITADGISPKSPPAATLNV